jgi:predicted acyl esterase
MDRAERVDEYVSDPANPVPPSEAGAGHVSRSGVRVWLAGSAVRGSSSDGSVGDGVAEGRRAGGYIVAELVASTSGTDCDWVVKLIDVYPDDAKELPDS